MASQGPLSPATLVSDPAVGTKAWTNPGNAASSNDARATADAGTAGITEYLKATNFGFTIPTGATINGIVVEVERMESAAGVVATDEHVKIVKGGTVGATNKADTATDWPTADAYASYGSATDLWGETWTVADINGTTFGMVIGGDIATGFFAATIGIDHIRITVHYTEAATGTVRSLTLLGVGT